MKIDPNANAIKLQVEIFGENCSVVVKGILDTGASYVMIPWKVAEKLGYDPVKTKERISITTASSTEKVPLITLKKVIVSGVEKSDVLAVCHDLPPQINIDVLIGLSFLKRHTTTIDLKEGEIIII